MGGHSWHLLLSVTSVAHPMPEPPTLPLMPLSSLVAALGALLDVLDGNAPLPLFEFG
jgi:hypothetical protein